VGFLGSRVAQVLGDDRGFDLFIRFGLRIPLTALSLALTFWSRYPRTWRWPMMAILVITGLMWITYVHELQTMPADYGYVGLILIQTFAFSILRLPFALLVGFDSWLAVR
jgi:hypothetical protein